MLRSPFERRRIVAEVQRETEFVALEASPKVLDIVSCHRPAHRERVDVVSADRPASVSGGEGQAWDFDVDRAPTTLALGIENRTGYAGFRTFREYSFAGPGMRKGRDGLVF